MSANQGGANDNDDDGLKMIVQKPELRSPEEIAAEESFTTDSKLHQARIAKKKRKPDLVPGPIRSFFLLVLIIAGIYAGLKLLAIKYGEDVGELLREALNNMREWFFK